MFMYKTQNRWRLSISWPSFYPLWTHLIRGCWNKFGNIPTIDSRGIHFHLAYCLYLVFDKFGNSSTIVSRDYRIPKFSFELPSFSPHWSKHCRPIGCDNIPDFASVHFHSCFWMITIRRGLVVWATQIQLHSTLPIISTHPAMYSCLFDLGFAPTA